MESLNNIILLSGGLDSTACLLKYVNSKHKKDPILYYIDLENNNAKSWCEQYAIHCILEDLKREKLLKSSCFLHIITVKDLKIKQHKFNKASVLPLMSLIFLTNLIIHMYNYKNKKTIVTIGYTKGDDATQTISYIKKLWNNLYIYLFIIIRIFQNLIFHY